LRSTREKHSRCLTIRSFTGWTCYPALILV
jgi:hypothetical protein